jgi:hypothetical protein
LGASLFFLFFFFCTAHRRSDRSYPTGSTDLCVVCYWLSSVL